MEHGAIILCGGQSSRMGRDKATLPLGSEMMLPRVVRLLSEVIKPENMVVVAASAQDLPPLPQCVAVSRDRNPDRGPLEGLRSGIEALPGKVDAFYATSCDVPFLVPAFVSKMLTQLGDYDIAVPAEDQLFHPLAAVYRRSVVKQVRQLLDQNHLRLSSLLNLVMKTRFVPVDELREADPGLRTLLNLNCPEDYQAALDLADIRLDQSHKQSSNPLQ